MLYFYPRPPRGGRPVGRQRRPAHSDFYPRPPRGGRHEARQMGLASYLFLSTPSARRATKAAGQIAKLMQFLSTPSARRATLRHETLKPHRKAISIHALREEGDSSAASPRASPAYFYPRPPRGGRLFVLQKSQIFFDYFYPRPPRGGRREKSRTKFILEKFLSTPSARRATSMPCST